MNVFKILFGIETKSLRNTCILTPFITGDILDGFKIGKMSKGVLFSVGSNDMLSLIYTGMGSAFLGDAVLYLKNTKCKNLILFGSCGVVKDNGSLNIGSVVTVERAIAQDSFVNMLLKRKTKDAFYPDRGLLGKVFSFKDKYNLEKVSCLTVGSLKLEEEYIDHIKDDSIDIVDMETAAFYAAAKYVEKKAVAILFVTDILKKFPFYVAIKSENREALKNLTNKISKLVYELVKGV